MGKISTLTGYIGTTSYRPDSIFSDQIHEGDITDLRSSAHDTNDMEVMNSVFNGAISGSERGSEGEWEIVENNTITANTISYDTKWGGTATYILANGNFSTEQSYGNLTWIDSTVGIFIKGNSGAFYRCHEKSVSSVNKIVRFAPNYGNVTSDFTGSSTYTYVIAKQSTRKKSNTITHCDIIGDPANYPQSWKDNGVIGTPLLVGENGEDYIPEGTSKTFKFSKKVSDAGIMIYSLNNGVTWTLAYADFNSILNSTTNSITQTYPVGFISMWFYTTHTNMAEPTVNSAVRNGVIGDVANLFLNAGERGAYLAQSLILKVSTANAYPYAAISSKISSFSLYNDGKLYKPAVNSSDLFGGFTIPETPAVKAFPYLTTENGRKVVNLVFKEMKFDVDWGDDSKFNIIDNVSTTTDDNANVVLIGQKKIVTPYFAKEK